jgi:hypothetical protein
MRIARYDNAQDNIPKVEEHDWPALVALLTQHRKSKCPARPCPGHCPAKNGPAWSPVDITDRRKNENVRASPSPSSTSITSSVQNDGSTSRRLGYAYVLHSTHSHDPDGRSPEPAARHAAQPAGAASRVGRRSRAPRSVSCRSPPTRRRRISLASTTCPTRPRVRSRSPRAGWQTARRRCAARGGTLGVHRRRQPGRHRPDGRANPRRLM